MKKWMIAAVSAVMVLTFVFLLMPARPVAAALWRGYKLVDRNNDGIYELVAPEAECFLDDDDVLGYWYPLNRITILEDEKEDLKPFIFSWKGLLPYVYNNGFFIPAYPHLRSYGKIINMLVQDIKNQPLSGGTMGDSSIVLSNNGDYLRKNEVYSMFGRESTSDKRLLASNGCYALYTDDTFGKNAQVSFGAAAFDPGLGVPAIAYQISFSNPASLAALIPAASVPVSVPYTYANYYYMKHDRSGNAIFYPAISTYYVPGNKRSVFYAYGNVTVVATDSQLATAD